MALRPAGQPPSQPGTPELPCVSFPRLSVCWYQLRPGNPDPPGRRSARRTDAGSHRGPRSAPVSGVRAADHEIERARRARGGEVPLLGLQPLPVPVLRGDAARRRRSLSGSGVSTKIARSTRSEQLGCGRVHAFDDDEIVRLDARRHGGDRSRVPVEGRRTPPPVPARRGSRASPRSRQVVEDPMPPSGLPGEPEGTSGSPPPPARPARGGTKKSSVRTRHAPFFCRALRDRRLARGAVPVDRDDGHARRSRHPRAPAPHGDIAPSSGARPRRPSITLERPPPADSFPYTGSYCPATEPASPRDPPSILGHRGRPTGGPRSDTFCLNGRESARARRRRSSSPPLSSLSRPSDHRLQQGHQKRHQDCAQRAAPGRRDQRAQHQAQDGRHKRLRSHLRDNGQQPGDDRVAPPRRRTSFAFGTTLLGEILDVISARPVSTPARESSACPAARGPV